MVQRMLTWTSASGLSASSKSNSAFSAIGHVSMSSMIGVTYAIIHDRTLGRFFLDSTNSTAALVTAVVTDIPSEALADTNGPVVFKFLSSNVSRGLRVSPSV